MYSVVAQGAAARSITGCAAPVVAMAPKESQNKVRKIYEAGSSKDDARQQLKAEGYKKARISQLLKDWPPDDAPKRNVETTLADGCQQRTDTLPATAAATFKKSVTFDDEPTVNATSEGVSREQPSASKAACTSKENRQQFSE